MKTALEYIKENCTLDGASVSINQIANVCDMYARMKLNEALVIKKETIISERTFLRQIKDEIETSHYGEGSQFNLSQISDRIQLRLKLLPKQ